MCVPEPSVMRSKSEDRNASHHDLQGEGNGDPKIDKFSGISRAKL